MSILQLPKKVSSIHNFLNLKKLIFQCKFISLGTSCNKNQTCIKVLECPLTKKMLEDLTATNDAKEKEKLIASIRSRVCGNSSDKTVCCDTTVNGEYNIRFDFLVLKLTLYLIKWH